MKEIQIYFITKALWLRIIFVLVISIAMGYLYTHILSLTTDARIIIFLSLLALAGLLMIFLAITDIKRLFSEEPALIIDEAGIYLHSSNRISGLITWENIENLKVESRGIGKKFIYPMVRNDLEYIEKLNPISTLLAYMLKAFKGSPIIIEASPLDIEMDELIAILIRYWEYAHREEGA